MKHFSSPTTFDIILSPRGDGSEDDVQQSDASDTEGDAYHATWKGASSSITIGGGGGGRGGSGGGSRSSSEKKGRKWHLRCDTFSEFEYWVPVFIALTNSANSGERLFR